MQIITHLKLVSGNRVVVMIDNLGGTSFMEMNIVAAETRAYLGMTIKIIGKKKLIRDGEKRARRLFVTPYMSNSD